MCRGHQEGLVTQTSSAHLNTAEVVLVHLSLKEGQLPKELGACRLGESEGSSCHEGGAKQGRPRVVRAPGGGPRAERKAPKA